MRILSPLSPTERPTDVEPRETSSREIHALIIAPLLLFSLATIFLHVSDCSAQTTTSTLLPQLPQKKKPSPLRELILAGEKFPSCVPLRRYLHGDPRRTIPRSTEGT